ncbi:MAG: DUF3567 domain-containing protein [Rubrivivax sp.]
MEMIYDSDAYAVLHLPVPAPGEADSALLRSGYEIVDKAARREIFLEGALAEHFREGVEALVRDGARTSDVFDAYIERFGGLAQHPLALH